MEKKLRATPLVVQLPLGQGRDFTGVLDLLTMDVLTWSKGGDGRNFTRVPLITHTNEDGKKDFKQLSSKQLIDSLTAENLPLDSKLVSEALDMRYNLAEQVSEISACISHIRKEKYNFSANL
jgi:elongation factor G